jgi:S-adenosylmethionine:tRNA ribosyltransferase-isomerase
MTTALPYSYQLPDERIAQRPVHPPESAKMLVVSRQTGTIEHRTFRDIGQYLKLGDHLVFNDTKVIPARLFGCLEAADGYAVEVVLIEEVERDTWSALGFPMRKIRAAQQIYFNQELCAEVLPSPSEDRLRLRFLTGSTSSVADLIQIHGTMPIPPYIRNGRADDQDRVDYQSVFAVHPGSVAAPTASLHFTEELVAGLEIWPGCLVDRITLHVGTASFQPIIVNGVLRTPSSERFIVPHEVLDRLQGTRTSGGRVVAVGTTVVRALESAARNQAARDQMGSTELFIQPGLTFELVDVLVTNFHQPRTTHLLLVEALLGLELLDRVYQEALKHNYRFLSYGDGMIIV